MAVKKDIDSLIKEHLDQAKKLKEKKFQDKFKDLFSRLRKYQDKITDEDIELINHNLDKKYGKKPKENQENQEEKKRGFKTSFRL